MSNRLLCSFLGIMMTVSVFAGGFRVSLQGVRQAAMAHTSAHVKDASVIFFNPAGMSFIEEKLSVTAGFFGVSINSEYQDYSRQYSHKTDNPISTPAYFGVSYRVSDMVSVGLSVTTPYGNTVEWGKDWNGRDLVQDIELKSFFFQPTVSFKFTDWFSAGLGFIYARGNVELNRALTTVNGDLQLKTNDADGKGFNVGAYFRPSDKLDVSLAYRTKVDMKVKKGKANFNVPSSLIGNSPFLTANDTFDATLPLASEFTAGLTYRVKPNFILSGDFNASGWQAYHRLTFDFGQNQVGNNPEDPTISTTPKDFQYTFTYRLGGEYIFKNDLALRLGYYYDESPATYEYFSPETPTTDNSYFTFGLGYEFQNGISLDGFGSALFGNVKKFDNQFSGFQGQLKNDGFIFGFGITYNK